MTKGLAFLSKKKFHPGRRDNMEKVWLAEEKEKNEKQKLEELKRERREQDEIAQLRAALEEKGEKNKERRPQWMTMMADVGSSKSIDDFLKGSQMVEDPAAELKKTSGGALFASSTIDPYQDARNKVREDPLFEIKQQEQAQMRSILSNPFIMQKLAHDQSEEVQKKLEKAKKKGDKKKIKKYKKQLAHLDEITSIKDVRSLREKIQADLKGEKSSKGKHHHHHRHHHHHHHSKERDASSSSSSSSSNDRSGSVEKSRHHSRHTERERSVSRKHSSSHSRSHSHSHSRSRSRSPSHNSRSKQRSSSPKRYGVRQIGAGAGVRRDECVNTSLDGLTRPQSIIAPRTSELESLKRLSRLNKRTEEEKQKEIERMKEDAKDLQAERIERIKAEHEKESKEQMEILNKPFQSEALSKSENSIDFSTMTLAGRLNAKRNNLQKDLDSF